MYGSGISKESEIIDLGVKLEIVEKSGSWFSYKDIRIGQVRENVKHYLKEHPAICYEIEQLIRQKSSNNTNITFDSETVIMEEDE